MPPERLSSYTEFWPYYVAQHLHPLNRALHVCGTALALASLALGAFGTPLAFAAAPVAGYGPAWIGHFVFERNKPATFLHPLWSLAGDFQMFGLILTGRMRAQLDAARRLYPAGA